jgi:hypothetical protein
MMLSMVSKILAIMVCAVGLAAACECREPSVEIKRDHAEIIFRGTIVDLRSSSKPSGIFSGFARDLNATVVFKVDRVWKGHVGHTFEMPAVEETSACIGFWPDYLKVGADLLVYATRFDGAQLMTGICGGHKLTKDAKRDLRVLGRGQEPDTSLK